MPLPMHSVESKREEAHGYHDANGSQHGSLCLLLLRGRQQGCGRLDGFRNLLRVFVFLLDALGGGLRLFYQLLQEVRDFVDGINPHPLGASAGLMGSQRDSGKRVMTSGT